MESTIFKYLEYPDCLDGLCSIIRLNHPNLSTYEILGENLGIDTRTKTKKILKGQLSMPSEVSKKLTSLAGLNEKSVSYFKLLNRLHFSKDATQSVMLTKKILELRRTEMGETSYTTIEEKQLAVFEKWFLFPLLFYFDSEKTKMADPHKISSATRGQLSPSEVEEALSTLKKLDLLEECSQGLWRRKSKNLSLLDHAPRVAVRNFHRMMISKALQSVEFPNDQRFLSGAVLSIRKEDVPKVQEKICQFLKGIVEMYGTESDGQINQLQCQFFPLISNENPE